uniref:transposase n=1 Tax=Pectobacterium versatile TaxID=2488639 RepID=UPI001F3CBE2F
VHSTWAGSDYVIGPGFRTQNEVQEVTERWSSEYNRERLHESLNDLMPEEY